MNFVPQQNSWGFEMKEFEEALHQVFGDHFFSEELKRQLRALFELGQMNFQGGIRADFNFRYNKPESMIQDMRSYRRESVFVACELLTAGPSIGFCLANTHEARSFWIETKDCVGPLGKMWLTPEGRQAAVSNFLRSVLRKDRDE